MPSLIKYFEYLENIDQIHREDYISLKKIFVKMSILNKAKAGPKAKEDATTEEQKQT